MSAFADWLSDHASPIATLAPNGPLDDLEPLAAIIGHARVVAVGESAHFVSEYTLARQRILRFLNERCGFTVFAFEFGFSEGFGLAPWVEALDDNEGLEQVSETAAAWGAGNLLRFLKQHNRKAPHPLRFVGIDIPEAGGSLLPALTPLSAYLRDVDPDMLPMLEVAIQTATRFANKSAASSAPAWAKLPAADQDALTAALTRLLLRFRALETVYVSRSNQRRFDLELRRLEAAIHADYMLRALTGLFAGTGLPGDPSVRDMFMAESVLWHLERLGPETRIVLAAHNSHIQKTPVEFAGRLTSLPMGQYLQRRIGSDYAAIALTSTGNSTVEMFLDQTRPTGFRIAETNVGPPEPGSLEAALVESGIGDRPHLIDLRRVLAEVQNVGPDCIRTQSAYMRTPVCEAFDGVVAIPTVTIEKDLHL